MLTQKVPSISQEKMQRFVYKIPLYQLNLKFLKTITHATKTTTKKLGQLWACCLCSGAKLVTSSGKHQEKDDNLHPVCLMYRLLTSNQQTSQLMYEFEESENTRRSESLHHKTEKGTFFVRIKLKDLIGFADQEKITHGLGYNLSLKCNNNNNAVDVAKKDKKTLLGTFHTLYPVWKTSNLSLIK